MPTLLRNPFRKQDENLRPTVITNGTSAKPGGTPTSNPIDIAPEKEQQPAEYKLSEINDSGVFIPPSPPERKSFWSTASSRSTTSTNYRSLLNNGAAGDDQFSISRESFDSYRRSFDISARSPVIQPYENGNGRPRASLDSRTFMPPMMRDGQGRSSNSFTRPSQTPLQEVQREQEFEDVEIHDNKPAAAQPKKRGLFSRITDYGDHADRPISADGGQAKGSSWHHFGGRKRGQSGQGSELGAIPTVKREGTPKAESQLRKETHGHAKHGSVDHKSTPTPGKETPKVKDSAKAAEKQATSGAAQPLKDEGAGRVDSAVDEAPSSSHQLQGQEQAQQDEVEEEMKEVSLDDTPKPQSTQRAPEVKVDAAPAATSAKDEGSSAPKSTNAQAPEKE